MAFARQHAGASRALGGSRPAPPGPSPWLLTPEARLLRGLLVGRPPRVSTQPVSRAAGDSSTRRVLRSPLSVPCGARVPSPLVPRPFCHVALPRALCVAPRWFPARPAQRLRADCASGKRRLARAARPLADTRQRPEDAGGRAAWALSAGTGDVGRAAAVEASAAAPQKTERCPATQPPAAASTPGSVGGGVWKRRLRTRVRGRLGEKGGHPKCPSGDKGVSRMWSVYSLKKEADSDTRPREDEAERHYAP